jgi:hypothetical protein
MQNSKRIVRLTDVDPSLLPFKKTTAYKWHCLKLYPSLIFKGIGGVLVDLDELDRMYGKAKEISEKEAARIHRPLEVV